MGEVAIENLDYRPLIAKWDDEWTTFYIDPPYVGVEADYYDENRDDGFDHSGLRDVIENIKGSVVVSYYRSDFVSALYEGFRAVERTVKTNVGQKRRQETEVLFVRRSEWARERSHRPRNRLLQLDGTWR
jgi:site-specific DNA-adenine methylase